MDTSGVSYNLIALIVLLVSSAFFSSAETAMFSANKLRIRSLAEKGDKRALKVQKLLTAKL